MAVDVKYNKTAMQELQAQLSMREIALPTLRNKESALRQEVKNYKDRAVEVDQRLAQRMKDIDDMMRLWNEFDSSMVQVRDAEYRERKIAGVRVPVLERVQLETKPFNLHRYPVWILDGVRLLEDIVEIQLERTAVRRAVEILELARKKTTQKVNLYEKVQIPDYREAIRRIKRFLEDEENLSKAGQKILKNRKVKA